MSAWRFNPRPASGLVFWRHYRSYSELEDRAYELLQQVLLRGSLGRRSRASLTHGEQRKLEIAILLALDPEVLLLDEPTAGMSLEEVPAILEIIQQIKAGRNRTILLVEHKFDMIMTVSDTIAVLKDGAPDLRRPPRNRGPQPGSPGGLSGRRGET